MKTNGYQPWYQLWKNLYLIISQFVAIVTCHYPEVDLDLQKQTTKQMENKNCEKTVPNPIKPVYIR